MKYSGIGGQAVMEGVMMQNKDTYAVAVRKPDHEIDVKVSKRKNSKTLDAIRKIPILRGVVSFGFKEKGRRTHSGRKEKKGCQRKETGKCHAWRYSGTVNCHSTRAVFCIAVFPFRFF